MRLMLTFKIPVEKGNEAEAEGKIGPAIEKLVNDTKAEAAYFTMLEGLRSGIIIFEESDQANLTKYNEPMFAALNAEIDIVPVLTLDDLKRGL